MEKQNKKVLVFMGLGVIIALLIYAIYTYLNSLKTEVVNGIAASNNLIGSKQGSISNQSTIAKGQSGRYFLGKKVINLTHESIDNLHRLTDVPKATSYCIIHLIDCEVEYNQDGDFTNGSPKSNVQITIDSVTLIEAFCMKVVSVISPNAKIYIEYYQ